MSSEKSPEVDPRFDPAFQRGFDPTIPIEEYVPPVQPRRSAAGAGAGATASAAASPSVTPAVSPEDRRFAPATPVTGLPSTDAAAPGAAPSTGASSASLGANPDSAVAEQASDQVAVSFSDGHSQQDSRQVTAADAQFDASVTRNPFLLVIGVIAVALVGAGIWLFVLAGDAFNSTIVRSQGDYMSLDATIHAAPFLALLGGATAIGVLFVFAVRYRRRR